MALTRIAVQSIYSAIYSCSLDYFNAKRTFDSDIIKENACQYLKVRHHPDEFAKIPIDSLVNKYYEIIYGLDDKNITDHLHQTIGKGQWKRERPVSHEETFRFIVNSVERETQLLYKKPYKL
jgi:hypothetical protein